MARAGLGSRRENEKVIEAGQVKVNGKVAKLGDKADENRDKIEVNGRSLTITKHQPIYIALYKPKGIISSLDDELGAGRRTVRDLVDVPGHLYPVGRLDKQSMGLMLMTNDGDLAHKLTHPRYGHSKTYRVSIEGEVTQDALTQWRRGIWYDGKKTIPAEVDVLEKGKEFTLLQIVMKEGRKRQIRRVAAQLGYTVMQLVRMEIGPIQLGDLRPGQWRHLQGWEINQLRQISQSKPKTKRPFPQGQKKKERSGPPQVKREVRKITLPQDKRERPTRDESTRDKPTRDKPTRDKPTRDKPTRDKPTQGQKKRSPQTRPQKGKGGSRGGER